MTTRKSSVSRSVSPCEKLPHLPAQPVDQHERRTGAFVRVVNALAIQMEEAAVGRHGALGGARGQGGYSDDRAGSQTEAGGDAGQRGHDDLLMMQGAQRAAAPPGSLPRSLRRAASSLAAPSRQSVPSTRQRSSTRADSPSAVSPNSPAVPASLCNRSATALTASASTSPRPARSASALSVC